MRTSKSFVFEEKNSDCHRINYWQINCNMCTYTRSGLFWVVRTVDVVDRLDCTIGTIPNYDSDGKESIKKAMGVMNKTTTLHVHHLFCTFPCCPCTTMTWNDQIVSLVENGKGEAINFTISVWTRARSPLFTCNLNSLLLTNRATWENLEKVYNDAKSIFQRRFHGRCRCRIARFLMKTEGVKFLLFT